MTDILTNSNIMDEKIIVVLDFDDTIAINYTGYRFTEKDIPSLLEKMKKKDYQLFISSRNLTYKVVKALKKLAIFKYFTDIFVDFRPKKYHIRQLIMELTDLNVKPKMIVFVDDFLENCLSVSSLKEEYNFQIISIKYELKTSLKQIFTLLINSDFEKLLSLVNV